MMNTVDLLKRSIAKLEKEDPESWLLKDFKEQLAALEFSDGKSAEQLYYSGNPVVPTSQPATDDQMIPAMNGLEAALRRATDRGMAKRKEAQSAQSASTTPAQNAKS